MPKTNETKSKTTMEQEVLDQQMMEAPVEGLENVSADGSLALTAEVIKNVANQKMDDVFEECESLGDITLGEFIDMSNNKIKQLTGWDKDTIRGYKTAAKNEINPQKEEEVEETQEETDMADQNQESEVQIESQESEMVEKDTNEQVSETKSEPKLESKSEEVKEVDRELPPIEVTAEYKCPARYLVNARYDIPHKKMFVGWDFFKDFNPKLERYFVGLSEFSLRKWFRQVPAPDGSTSYKDITLGDKRWRWWGLKEKLEEQYLSVSDFFNERCTIQRNTTTLEWEDDVAVRIKSRSTEDAYKISSSIDKEKLAALQLPKGNKEKVIAPSLGNPNSTHRKSKEEAEVLGAKLYFAFCDDKRDGKLKKDIDVVRWMRMKADNYDISLDEVRTLLKRNGLKIM